MKLANIDPMPMLRLEAIALINERFNRRSHERAHIDHAHMRKRHTAAAVLAGEPIAKDHPFLQEAVLRGVNVHDFAQVIVNKTDEFAARELYRQQIIASIEIAATPAELDAITSRVG